MKNRYTELHCHSYFSLLDGVSSPEALVAEAQRLGMTALALTDHHSLAGAVRFWTPARKAGIRPLLGAEITLPNPQGICILRCWQRRRPVTPTSVACSPPPTCAQRGATVGPASWNQG
jgi:DNA polymerase III alpha subunit